MDGLEQHYQDRRDKILRTARKNGRVQDLPPEPALQHQLDERPVDWDARIRDAVKDERQHMDDVFAEIISHERKRAADNLKRATCSLAAEIAELRVALAELRLAVLTDKEKEAKVIDLPNPILRKVRDAA